MGEGVGKYFNSNKTKMNKPMLSFHNDPAIKEKYLARLRDHYAADEIVKGHYWENGTGCAWFV